jgi:hypothetical protein
VCTRAAGVPRVRAKPSTQEIPMSDETMSDETSKQNSGPKPRGKGGVMIVVVVVVSLVLLVALNMN